ncbi:hypothetical protein A1OW_21635 [Enterovibrio norvegicus]|uniref:hypothetical protein n=1 Tax=Enterovibrio norvegicus TaxID=188144 RepID=UPI00031B8B32|nr:hypothetical protein [Enterovibrio norvegicus]OEF59284.1 hypothetical protein A1OW_21635 [Enterovibrio norvegicus]
MAGFSDRFARLDRKVMARLGDGEAIIDGVPIQVMFEKNSVLFGEGRGTERAVSFPASLAREAGVKPHSNSRVTWEGQGYRLSEPPQYQDGMIRLVLT